MKNNYLKILSAVTAVAIMGTTVLAGGTSVRAENEGNNAAIVTESAIQDAAVNNQISDYTEGKQLEDYEKEYLEKRQKEYAELEAKVGKDETEILENGRELSYRWIYADLHCIVTQETEQDEEAKKKLEEDIRNMYSGHTIQRIGKESKTIENGEKDMIHSEYYLDLTVLSEDWEERLNLLEVIRKDSRVLWAEYDVKKLVRTGGGYEIPEGGISDSKEIITTPIPTMIPTSLPTQTSSIPTSNPTPLPTETTSIPTSPKTADVTTAFPWMITGSISLLVLVTLSKRKDVIE